tara:strand:- start:4495 stop:5454 length:960 start_codon:yes stop_codon:yes gene_type:complete
MVDKDWQGADLIFDLDGDHLPGVSDNDFPAMIELIQEQAWSLWNDFLEPEFDMKKEYAQFTFSGHRGFHIHVRDPTLMGLDSNARREIVNYIRGEGLDVNAVLTGEDSGWHRRIEVGMESVLAKLGDIAEGNGQSKAHLDEFHSILNDKRGTMAMKRASVSRNRIKSLADACQNDERIMRLKEDHNLAVFGKETTAFWDLVKGDNSVVLGTAGETDENVTVDVKRVIRFLGSLHGKCGLRVTEVPFNRLDPESSDPFDPLSEAIALTGGNTAKVELIKEDVRARILEETIEGGSGQIVTVSDALATFLCLKGWAKQLAH